MLTRYLDRGRPLPHLVAPDGEPASAEFLLGWIHAHRETLDTLTLKSGAVLIRGFGIGSPEAFRAVCAAVRPGLRSYAGGDSPRRAVADGVYTSTEYPPHLEILLHNELSYAGWSPERVFFGCLEPAATGGETPLADGREIYRRLDAEVRERFESRGVTYLQHLRHADGVPGPGKSWQDTFESDDRAAVEAYLVDADMSFQWTALGIRTAARHDAVVSHPLTGEKCWHNQADQWHRGLPSVKDSVPGVPAAPAVSDAAGGEAIGNHVTFGDGGEIDIEDLLHIRQTARECEVIFPWRAGDVLVIDNVMTMHGRKPYTGERRVLVAMA